MFNQFDTSSASLSFLTSCPRTAERSCRLTWWTLDCMHLCGRRQEINAFITHLFAADSFPYKSNDCNNNLLITGTSSGKILLYWRISWKHLVARYRNTDDTFTSSFTDVRIRRQAIFFDSWSASSLNGNIARQLLEYACKCNSIYLTCSQRFDRLDRFCFVQLSSGWFRIRSQSVTMHNITIYANQCQKIILLVSSFWSLRTTCDPSSWTSARTPGLRDSTIWWLHRIPPGRPCPTASTECPRRRSCDIHSQYKLSKKAASTNNGSVFVLNLALQEVHTDRLLVFVRVHTLAVALDHRALAHTAVAHNHDLHTHRIEYMHYREMLVSAVQVTYTYLHSDLQLFLAHLEAVLFALRMRYVGRVYSVKSVHFRMGFRVLAKPHC